MPTLIEIEGKKVHAVDLNPNAGRPLIMIHGLFTNLSVFYFSIAPTLAKRRRVILYDLRGHGSSEPIDGIFSLENLSDDLLALMKHYQITSASFAGYSYGGDIALYMALQYPEMTDSLALIETPLLSETVFDRFCAGDFDKSAAFEEGLNDTMKSVGIPITDGNAVLARARYEWLMNEGELASAFREGRAFFKDIDLKRIKMPTFLVYGNKSPYRATGRFLKSNIHRSKIKIGRGDHNLPVTRAAWMAKRLGRVYK